MKNVLKKNWNHIFEEKTFRNVEPLIRDAFTISKGLDGLVISSRIKRLTHITRALTISFEGLKELKTLPWLKDSIEQSIALYKTNYLEEVKKENAKDLKEIREQYEMEVLLEKERADEVKRSLNKQIDDLKNALESKRNEQEKILQDKRIEVDLIDETIQGKKKSIKSLDESISRLEKRKMTSLKISQL